MVREAPRGLGSGCARLPVVRRHVGDAAWLRNDAFGNRCVFESSPRVFAERPDAEPQMFADTGTLARVLEPGKPTGMFHALSYSTHASPKQLNVSFVRTRPHAHVQHIRNHLIRTHKRFP